MSVSVYLVIVLTVGMSSGNADLLVPLSEDVPVAEWTSMAMYCEEPEQPGKTRRYDKQNSEKLVFPTTPVLTCR
jgi:hypothetical protein